MLHRPVRSIIFVALAAGAVFNSGRSLAQPEEQTPAVGFEGGLVGTYLDSDDSAIGGEGLLSIDLVTTVGFGPGQLLIYAEGSSSPQPGDVSNVLGEANADAGTALDGNGDGRLQVSEFRYALPITNSGTLYTGLMDLTAFYDASGEALPSEAIELTGIANDEATQFLGASFVNNPTIEFPDYTLGVVYSRKPRGRIPGLKLAITGSNGLADNPDASYSELFDVGASDKGVYAGTELYWNPRGKLLARLGGWTNTRDHMVLSGAATGRNNYGVYGLLDGGLGALGSFNIRAGWADEDVSPATTFASLAAEFPVGPAFIGAAVAHIGASDKLGSGSDDTLHSELFARFEMTPYLIISPDIQYVKNSGFEKDLDAFVYGLRITALYSVN